MISYNKFKSRWDVSLKYGEEAIAIARELNLRELLAYVLNDIYLGYSVMGRFNAATQALEESSALWRELNNMAMLGDNLSGLANLRLFLGDAKRSIEIADESYRLNLKMHNTWGRSYSAWALGQAHAFTGDITQAIFFLEESIRFGEEVGFRVPPIAARCLLAYIFSRAGQSERGLKVLQEAFEYGQDFMRWLPFVFTVRAQLYVEQGDFTKATEALQHIEAPLEQLAPLMQLFLVIAKCKLMFAQNDWAGIATFIEPIVKRKQQANAVLYSIDYFYYQAQAYIGLGHLAEGRAILIWACQEAQTAQSRVALYPCLLALANLETEPTEKHKWLTQAREAIMYIADHSPADLRETFLQTPDVKHVLESS